MIIELKMPKFGLIMEEASIVQWYKNTGDTIKKGDEIVEVISEKLTNIITAPVDGVMGKIVAQADDMVPCGGVIAELVTENAEGTEEINPEAVKGTDADESPANVKNGDVKAETKPASKPGAAGGPGEAPVIEITPRAKMLAMEKNIDYSGIVGTGIGGAITVSDLKKHLP